MWKKEYGPDKQRVVTSVRFSTHIKRQGGWTTDHTPQTQIGFTGIILGQLSFGFIVDKYSRKTGMLASSIILITFSILASLAKGVGPRVQGIVSTVYQEFNRCPVLNIFLDCCPDCLPVLPGYWDWWGISLRVCSLCRGHGGPEKRNTKYVVYFIHKYSHHYGKEFFPWLI